MKMKQNDTFENTLKAIRQHINISTSRIIFNIQPVSAHRGISQKNGIGVCGKSGTELGQRILDCTARKIYKSNEFLGAGAKSEPYSKTRDKYYLKK